jgi:putative zinc finger protein
VPVHPVHPDPEQLAAWQAGELRGRESARIQAHVTGCADCAGVVAAVERGRSALDRLAEPDLPAGLHERLAVAIERERVAAAEVVGNGARHGGQEGSPVAEPVPLDARRARRQHRAAGPRARSHRPGRRRAALLSTAAAVILLVGGLFPLIRYITEGNGSTQTASGAATAQEDRGSAQSLSGGGIAAVPVFSAPGGYSANAFRAALQSNPEARAAYDQAVRGTNNDRSSASGGSGQPSTVEPFRKEPEGAAPNAGGTVKNGVPQATVASGVAQATCVSAARDRAGDQSLRPAFFVNTVYQGRSATVLVTVRPGAANQADLWAFPQGDCSAAPFAHEQVTVPSR